MYRTRAATLIMAAAFLSSCISTFTVVNREDAGSGKKLAVLSGLNKPENLAYAIHLTEALRKYTAFSVMPQEEVRSRIPAYPFRIRGPYISYIGLDPDYTRTNTARIDELQKKLGADYLYVIWTPSSYTTDDSIVTLSVVGQMFSYPGAREVGHGDYDISWAKPGAWVIGPKKSPEETMRQFSERSAREIAKKLGVAAPASERHD